MNLDRSIILARNAALVSIAIMAGAMLFRLPFEAVIIAQFAFSVSFFATFILRVIRFFVRLNE